ncbi:MAG: hypothetical protein IPG66_08675 [Hydrogenophilales bacterium]|nr:hypothetical protein [Hydrogenophilales bacterium]
MNARALGFAALLFLATGLAQAEGKNDLTIQKIKAVSDSVESASLLVTWLKTKPGVREVHSSFTMLTSLPGKRDVLFRLNGEPQVLRVSVGWRGKVTNTKLELQRMDSVLAQLDAAEKPRLENASTKAGKNTASKVSP